jgi:general secretion pathway protein G
MVLWYEVIHLAKGVVYFPPRVIAPTESTVSQIHNFQSALRQYYLDIGVYPSTEQGLQALIVRPTTPPASELWKGPYLQPPVVRKDSWGHDFIYVNPGTHDTNGYDLFSVGPDGIPGTKDDIGNWQ